MKSLLLTIGLLTFTLLSYSQNIYQIRADSVRIYNDCDTAELILENRTQNVPGFLYNKGRGRTEFRRLSLSNLGNGIISIDGQDTLDLSSAFGDSFIQNQFSVAQNANLWINGQAKIDNMLTFSAYKNSENWDSVLTTDMDGNVVMKYIPGEYELSEKFIQNSSSLQYPGTFNISGDGKMGGSLFVGNGAEVHGPVNIYHSQPGIQFWSQHNNVTLNAGYLMKSSTNNALELAFVYDGLYFRNFGKILMTLTDIGQLTIGNETNATAMLDVNGNVRFRQMPNTGTMDSVLTTDASGYLKLKALNGATAAAVNLVSSSLTLTSSHYTVLMSNTSDVTVTLPSASANTGRIYFIKKITSNSNTVTILPSGTEKIDNAANYVLSTGNKTVQVQSSGSGWFILSVY